MNKIICGDALEVLKTLESESVDCVITSPPYDNMRKYKGFTFNFEGIARELYRTLKTGGVIVWIVGDQTINGSESGTSFRQALHFKDLGLNLHDTMIYEKNGTSFPDTNRYYQVFEYMFVLSKGPPKTANLIADRKNNWGGTGSWGQASERQEDGTLKKKNKIAVKEYGVRYNIWRENGGKGFTTRDEFAYEHPAMFPEKLAEGHILTWTREGNLILDPMCGAGTTLKMAKKHARNYIGIDISKEYCELAERRVNLIPQNMFAKV